jgi:hypothetical protein
MQKRNLETRYGSKSRTSGNTKDSDLRIQLRARRRCVRSWKRLSRYLSACGEGVELIPGLWVKA